MRSIAIIGWLALASASAKPRVPKAATGRCLPTSPSSRRGRKPGASPATTTISTPRPSLEARRYSALYTRGLAGTPCVGTTSPSPATRTERKVPAGAETGVHGGLQLSPRKLQGGIEGGLLPRHSRHGDAGAQLRLGHLDDRVFGQLELEHLKLNAPTMSGLRGCRDAGPGLVSPQDLQLIWTGISKRNGQECAVVDYQAFFNQVAFSNPVLSLIGRSHYWARSGCRGDQAHRIRHAVRGRAGRVEGAESGETDDRQRLSHRHVRAVESDM